MPIDEAPGQPAVQPAVAVDSAGGAFVVWDTFNDIFARRFDSSGTPLGGQFQVGASGDRSNPRVATNGVGNTLVVWAGDGIIARRVDASGTPIGAQFRINTFMPNFHSLPAIAATATGGFVVVSRRRRRAQPMLRRAPRAFQLLAGIRTHSASGPPSAL